MKDFSLSWMFESVWVWILKYGSKLSDKYAYVLILGELCTCFDHIHHPSPSSSQICPSTSHPSLNPPFYTHPGQLCCPNDLPLKHDRLILRGATVLEKTDAFSSNSSMTRSGNLCRLQFSRLGFGYLEVWRHWVDYTIIYRHNLCLQVYAVLKVRAFFTFCWAS